MHFRSLGTGLAAIGFAFFSIAAGISVFDRSFLSSDVLDLHSAAALVEPSALEVDEELVFPTLPDNDVGLTSSSSSTRLHEAPLEYLKRVKGDPQYSQDEVAVRVPVVMYHHVRPLKASFTAKDRAFNVTPESLRAQLEGIKRAGYTTITPRDLQAAIEGKVILPDKSVLLTFDDGYREHFTQVLPVLRELDLKATYFIISEAYRSPAHMTQEMIREADQSGLVTIASHTRHHIFLARAGALTQRAEVEGSKTDLENLLGHPILDFAYPFGSYDATVAQSTRNAGYQLGFGVRLGSVHAESSRYNLRRIRVLDGENLVSLLDAFSAP